MSQENLFGWKDHNPRSRRRKGVAPGSTVANKRKFWIGETHGNLTIVAERSRREASLASSHRDRVWLVRCECGKEAWVVASVVSKGRPCRRCSSIGGRPSLSLEPFRAQYNRIKYNAIREGKIFALSFEKFLELTKQARCFYCWAGVSWAPYRANNKGSNLDRFHNAKGYLDDNVVVCCWTCNAAKGKRYDGPTWYKMTSCYRTVEAEPLSLDMRTDDDLLEKIAELHHELWIRRGRPDPYSITFDTTDLDDLRRPIN